MCSGENKTFRIEGGEGLDNVLGRLKTPKSLIQKFTTGVKIRKTTTSGLSGT